MSSLSETIRQKVSESGYPGLKDEQDEYSRCRLG
jgi:hypothetical protein